jgi:hypothetical protein
MPTIFDHLKNITTTKGKYLGDEGWSNYMINRYLSMNQDYIELVNIIQKNTWQMKGENLYSLYKDIIPKSNVYLKYIKSKTSSKYKPDEIEAIQKYYQVSKREAKDYIDLLSKDDIKDILKQINGKVS